MTLEDLIYTPSLLGSPYYPLGMPRHPRDHSVNGKTMEQRIAEYYKSMATGDALSDLDMEIIAQFAFYNFSAPMYSAPGYDMRPKELVDALENLQPTAESMHALEMTCLEHGLNVF